MPTAAPPPLQQYVSLELYSIPLDEPSEAVRLNADLAPGEDVYYYEISPDSKRAVYVTADADERNHRLFSCRTDGGDPPIPLANLGRHSSFSISPDGQRLVWREATDKLASKLVSGPLTGSGDLVTLDQLENRRFWFWLTNDGKRVVYLRSGDLRSRLIAGEGEPVTLNGPWSGNHGVDIFKISPNGEWVVFQIRETQGSGPNVYSRRVDGSGDAIRLSPLGSTDGTVLSINPDSKQVVFHAKSDGKHHFYLTSIDGTQQPVQLDDSESPRALHPMCKFSPDGRYAVFQAGEQNAIYSYEVDGQGDAVRLCASARWRDFAISPNSERVVYLERKEVDGVHYNDLVSRRIDGGEPPIKVFETSSNGSFVWVWFPISPDSRHVFFTAKPNLDSPYELYRGAIDGSTRPHKLSGPTVAGGDVWGFKVTPDGRQVVYLQQQSEYGPMHLFTRPLDGSGKPRSLNPPLNAGGGVYKFKISPDGKRVLCLAYQSTDELKKQLASHWKRTGSGPGTHQPCRDTPYNGASH